MISIRDSLWHSSCSGFIDLGVVIYINLACVFHASLAPLPHDRSSFAPWLIAA